MAQLLISLEGTGGIVVSVVEGCGHSLGWGDWLDMTRVTYLYIRKYCANPKIF